jgi:hypothetical protein
MSILVIAVVAVIFSVIFFGAFLGFVLRDNVDSIGLCLVFAVAPAAAIAFLCSQWLFGPLWLFSYWLGIQIADFLNQKEY